MTSYLLKLRRLVSEFGSILAIINPMRYLLALLLMLPVTSFTSPAHPVAGAAVVPAILGTWQAGRVLAVDRKTHQMHVDHSPVNPDLSDNSLMPYGQRIRLGSGYNKASDVAYWQIEWLVPYPPDACQFPLAAI